MGHSCDRNNHIERNHMDMCKFSGPEDSEYQKVSGEIKRHIIRLQAMITQERRSQYGVTNPPLLMTGQY